MATKPVTNVSFYPSESSMDPPEVYIDADLDSDADSGDASSSDAGMEQTGSGGAASALLPVTPNGGKESLGDATQRDAAAGEEEENRGNSDGMPGDESAAVDPVVSNTTSVADAGTGSVFSSSGTFGSTKSYGGEANTTAVADAGTGNIFLSSATFGSTRSYGSEAEGAQGEAEREAQEVQALVAEALALVQEASLDE